MEASAQPGPDRRSRCSINRVLVRTGEAQCSGQDCPSSNRDARPCRVIFCCSLPTSTRVLQQWGRRSRVRGFGWTSPTAGHWSGPGRAPHSRHRAPALMGSSLSPRVLEAWAQSVAQGRVQRVTITQFQHSHLLRTHWAQWRTALLRVRLEPRTEAQTSAAHPRAWAGLTHWPRLAGRGRLLVLMDGAARRVQVRWGPGGAKGPNMT